MALSELSIEESFTLLADTLHRFQQHLLDEQPRCWLPQHTPSSSTAQLTHLYTNIWYQDGKDGRETQSLWGLVGCSEELFAIALSVNDAKTRFKAAVQDYKNLHGDLPTAHLHKRAEVLAERLHYSGLSRLHLKQCYRLLPLLDEAPTSVRFNWYTSGRSIKRISPQQAEKMLLKLDSSQEHIQIQFKRLASAQQNEDLAQLQTQVPVMRANIVWQKASGPERKARNCPLPILFPLKSGQEFPEHNEPDITPPTKRQRQERSDLKIDPEPFLPSLRIHRYK